MRVLHVVAGLEAKDGGPSHTLPCLWAGLKEAGVEVRAYTTGGGEGGVSAASSGMAVVPGEFARKFPTGLKYSPALRDALGRDMPGADLCHNHGCWLYPNWVAGSLARRFRKPLVISPLGHLDPWSLARRRWAKAAARLLFEQANWNCCPAFIAKSAMEADGIRRLGLRQRIEVIPNGLNVDGWEKEASAELFFAKFPEFRRRRLLLFLSRIHPKKGIVPLLGAWRDLHPLFPDWQLVIAGDVKNAHGNGLRDWVSRHSVSGVGFVGALDGGLKRAALEAAELFVLPSFSENFGQAILEALAAGLPVVTTHGCPWAEIEKRGCGWWIELGGGRLRKALADAMRLEDTALAEMGRRGREWVLRDFSWKSIAARHCELYREVLNKAEG